MNFIDVRLKNNGKIGVTEYESADEYFSFHVLEYGLKQYTQYILPSGFEDVTREETIEGVDYFYRSRLNREARYRKIDLVEKCGIHEDDQDMEILKEYPDDEVLFVAKYYLDSKGRGIYLVDLENTYAEVLSVFISSMSGAVIFYICGHLYVISH